MDILDKIDSWGKAFRDRAAIAYVNEEITYQQLAKKSDLIAMKIMECVGTKALIQIPVVIIMERGINFVVSILGVLKSGQYYIPIEMPYPKERLEEILFQVDDCIVITDQDYDLLYNKSNIIKINIEVIENSFDTSDLVPGKKKLTCNDYCYMIFTSGTEGNPKGVLIKYQSLCNLVQNFLNQIYDEFDEFIHVGMLSSFGFDASIKQIFGALYYGHKLVISQRNDRMFSTRIQYFFSKNNISVVDGTPSIYQLLIKKENKNDWNVKYFLIGGEVMKRSFVNEFIHYLNYKAKIINVYGPTECCVDASYHLVLENEIEETEYVSIGKPIQNAYFHLHDSDGHIIDEIGKEGELYISGVLVAEGYFKQKSNRFIESYLDYGRTYKTGDLAVRNSNGDYFILGRIDDQVKVNGNRLEICEVEQTISNYIHRDVVVCLEKEKKCDFLYAFIYGVFKDTHEVEKDIYQYLKEKIPSYGIPKKLFFLDDEIPMTNNGKIDRKYLLKRYIEKM